MSDDTGTRPIEGLRLGLSISEHGGDRGHGNSSAEVNRAVLRISEFVIGLGGGVVFGHDWRDEGVMAAVFQFAVGYRRQPQQPAEAQPDPLVTNFVPWPDTASIADDERSKYLEVLQIEEVSPDSVPEPSDTSAMAALDGGEQIALRVVSLTDMRKKLVEHSDARLCLGGRAGGSSGRCAGVIEEAYLTMATRKPLYLSSMFGGATQEFINVLAGDDNPSLNGFATRADVAEALAAQGLQAECAPPDPAEIAGWGLDALSEGNGLSVEENEQLMHATQLTEVIGWTLTGMGRLANR